MVCCKVYLILSTLIACHVNANHESLKTLSQQIDVSQVPWNSRYDIYEGASSKVLPRFYDSYGSNRDRSGDYFGSSSEHLPIPSFKKEPRQGNEKKISKKPIIPFYALANGDSFKHKEFVPLSAIAHCREVKVKSIGEEPRKSFTTCYKCKDPKTKSTYERCSYNGPKRSASASTKVERFLSAPVSFRYRRSSLGEGVAGDSYGDYHGKLRHPYRFAEEYFIDATHDVPAAYENKGEVCDKVVKDSMVCMVCKDAKTNGKYEQCSYVNQPREKAYSYTKSSSFGKPQEEDDSADQPEETSPKSFNFEASDRRKDRNPTVVEESRSEYRYPSEDHSNRASTKKAKEQDDGVRDDATSADCKKVQKDSKTCVICKDPANGGTYEKCTYNYQPNEKLYKYSRSKNFGYPDKTSDSSFNRETAETSDKSTDYPQSSDATHDYFDSGRLEVPTYPRRSDRLGEAKEATDDSDNTLHDSAEHGNASNYPEGSSNTEYPISSSNTNSESDTDTYEGVTSPKSASEDNSEDNTDHCEKFQKDSMTCTVCKDPKTGDDFERCSYSYQPSDKLFSYSKSTSFGNSQRDRSRDAPHQDEESSDSSETAREGSYGYIPRQTYEASTADGTTSKDDDTEEQQSKKEVDTGYLNTARKKEEIEEFMQNFKKEDRSKCKKIMRDKMTCYQCVDEDGFQKEECVFVTGEESDKAQLAFPQVKQFQIDPAASSARRLGLSTPTRAKTTADLLEPNASASGNSYVRMEKPDNEYPEEAPHTAEETKEAEPYDYTSETRPRYDKVLGFTLPAYMFTTSEHEAAFDEIVASGRDQR